MSFKFLGILTLLAFLTSIGYGYNARRLELESDIYVGRILSNIPAADDIGDEEKMIRGSLSFLGDDEMFEEKYMQSASFQSFYEKSVREISTPAFANFSRACLNIYRNFETSSNKRKQVSVHMLFEKVKEKLALELKKLLTFEERKRKALSSSSDSLHVRSADLDRIFNSFIDTDK